MDTRIDQPILTEKLLKRIARYALDRRMRRTASALLTRSHSDLKDADYYLNVLDSPVGVRLKHRLIAAEALRFASLTTDQQNRAESVSRAIVSNKHIAPVGNFVARVFNISWRCMLCLIIPYLFLTFAFKYLLKEDSDGSMFALLGFVLAEMLITVVVPAWSIVVDKGRYGRLREVSAALLGVCGCPASIGTLLTVKKDKEVWRYAGPSLFHVLGALTVEDYGKVPPAGIEVLSSALHPLVLESDLDKWMPLILDSLEKVGTGSCIAAVQKVAGDSPVREWSEHAARILPILVERRRAEVNSARLLRAFDGGQKPDGLLRPIEGGNAGLQEHLLQPADQPGTDTLIVEMKAHG